MITQITFTRAGFGIPTRMLAGQTATAVLPADCYLRMVQDQSTVDLGSSYAAEDDCTIRVDCDTYAGTPVTATLEIE